ncbi:MAG TPA: hypothetical protein P5534_01225 [Candidatus Paceibacterota bacterium]|nr:hypothetical protein [Candidatus Paceibacterota bacterium]
MAIYLAKSKVDSEVWRLLGKLESAVRTFTGDITLTDDNQRAQAQAVE